MKVRRAIRCRCALLCVAFMPFVHTSAADLSMVRTVLKKQAHLDSQAVKKLQDGQIVTRLLDTREDSEIAILGGVVIAVPSEYFLNQFRDISNFLKSPAVLEAGQFSVAPSLSKLSKVILSRADIEAVKQCRLGNCNLKLSAAMIQQIARGMDLSSGGSGSVDLAFRTALVDYIRTYLADGNRALICYVDNKPPICMADVLNELLNQSSLLRECAPALSEWLAGSRQMSADNPERFLYWSKEKLGPLKPIVGVTQAIIYSNEKDGVRWNFIASKQIYASHYFQASLGLTVLVDIGQHSVLMLYIHRSRVDGLDGWLGAVKRAIVRHKVRSGMAEYLAGLRGKLERSYRGIEADARRGLQSGMGSVPQREVNSRGRPSTQQATP